MIKLQKIILVSLLSTAGISWLLSTYQPDMMSIMNTYNPILIALFTASWTAGMAAMMFPAIVPMVLLYNKLVTNRQSESSEVIIQPKSSHFFKVILFIGMYLVVWTLTGIGLLLGWSVPMNSLARFNENNILGLIFGAILIISGIYQFTPLKNKCIGYCESPLSFFMRRWKNGIVGAIKMGIYHGLYCLGCCWPYFLIMVALGWMNLAWMGLFAIIIFERMALRDTKKDWAQLAMNEELLSLNTSIPILFLALVKKTDQKPVIDLNQYKQNLHIEPSKMPLDFHLHHFQIHNL